MSDVSAVLDVLGIEYDQRGDELWGLCPGHEARTGRKDNNPSWSINAESGQHKCFSCGYAGGLNGLVAETMGYRNKYGLLDIDKAKDWLSARVDLSLPAIQRRLEGANDYQAPSLRKPMDESRMALFTDPPDWALEGRSLTRLATTTYGVRWDDSRAAFITPIRDPETFALWGWQEKGVKDRYFRNFPVNVPKSRTLFGIDRADADERWMVVESPLDVVRLASAGVTSAVSTMGAALSDAQMNLLLSNHQGVVVAMDNDKEGWIAQNHILEAAKDRGFPAYVWDYPHPDIKDPGQMTDMEIANAYDLARPALAHRLAAMGLDVG